MVPDRLRTARRSAGAAVLAVLLAACGSTHVAGGGHKPRGATDAPTSTTTIPTTSTSAGNHQAGVPGDGSGRGHVGVAGELVVRSQLPPGWRPYPFPVASGHGCVLAPVLLRHSSPHLSDRAAYSYQTLPAFAEIIDVYWTDDRAANVFVQLVKGQQRCRSSVSGDEIFNQRQIRFASLGTASFAFQATTTLDGRLYTETFVYILFDNQILSTSYASVGPPDHRLFGHLVDLAYGQLTSAL